MITESIDGGTEDKLALTEAELFIKRLFVQGDYKHYADKFQINRDDLKRILYESSIFLSKKKITCIIALILKTTGEYREVIVCRIGNCSSYVINSQQIRFLTEEEAPVNIITEPEDYLKPQLFTGKLKKEDTLLLCTERLSSVLEIKFIQRIVNSSKGPEEICKKLLHSASQTGIQDIISVAVFNGSVVRKNPVKVNISNKNLLLIILLPFLVVIGFFIYNLIMENKDKHPERTTVNSFEPHNLPPLANNDSVSQVSAPDAQTPENKDIVSVPENKSKKGKQNDALLSEKEIKKTKKELVAATDDISGKFKNVNFLVNGSVVLISNWEQVRKNIKSVNWENGMTDKKRIHKYSDYTNIPSSVKITFKDNSTKNFKIK
ncbi:MAG: hypothetical protein P4L27_14280 [Ignavibacteriaceae bacterium]|nr:hypothetical protein [Ignavibacteriaceae bacterium]